MIPLVLAASSFVIAPPRRALSCTTGTIAAPTSAITDNMVSRTADIVLSGVDEFDLNAALTALNAAVAAEDYTEAARLKALIEASATSQGGKGTVWPDSLPRWLLERLEQLGKRYPTPVQAAALQTTSGADAVLRAPTGSGKTLAYLVLALDTIAPSLASRSDKTCEAVAALDLSPTAAMSALGPQLSSGIPSRGAEMSAASIGGGSGEAGVPGRGSPLAIVLVPRDTLAEQVAGIAYSLLGGYARASRTWEPGASDSLFKYAGPKGGRVCVLRDRFAVDASALERAVNDCDVLVCSPSALAEAVTSADTAGGLGALNLARVFRMAEVAIVDEADECLDDFVGGGGSDGAYGGGRGGGGREAGVVDCLEAAPVRCRRLFAGATIGEGLMRLAVARGWLREPLVLANGDGGTREWLSDERGGAGSFGAGEEAGTDKAAAVRATEAPSIPPSVVHRAAVGDSSGTRLVLLARLMRADLREWEQRADKGASARPRAVVFTPDEQSAETTGKALRDALWGDQAVAVLLPSTGQSPTLVADKFRRATASDDGFASIAVSQSASVLVAPASSARGLDFANVSHVYAVGISTPRAAEYTHMAGRTGRVGQAGRGVMTSLVGSGEEVLLLQGVVEGELSRKLLLASNCVEEVESERRLQLEMQRREEERGQATDAGVLSSAMQTFEVDSGSGGGEQERDVSGLEATLEADVELSDAEQQAIDDLRRRLEDGFKNLDGEEGEEGAP